MLRIVADASDRSESYVGLAVIQTASTTASSTPRQLAFVPEPHTDFIFSVSPDGPSIIPLGMALFVLLVLIWYIRRRRARSRSLDE